MKIIEVDQWSSTARQWRDKSFTFAEACEADSKVLSGGDVDAVKALGIDTFRVLDTEDQHARGGPSIGRVWFCEGPDGYPKVYRSNIDSSD